MPSSSLLPKVSVVTISFKDRAGLEKTMASVREQDYAGVVEHIVVDGGSGDDVEKVLAASPGVRWVSERDDGRYDAMNKGIAMSDGDVLWFMNSADTFGSPSSISQVVNAVPDIAGRWGYGFARRIDAAGRFRGVYGPFPFRRWRFELGGDPVPHQAAFFGRDIVAEVGDYDLDHGLAADQLFILRAAHLQPPVIVPEFVCDFDVSGAGSARSLHLHFQDMRRSTRTVARRSGLARATGEGASRAVETVEYLRRGAGRMIRAIRHD